MINGMIKFPYLLEVTLRNSCNPKTVTCQIEIKMGTIVTECE